MKAVLCILLFGTTVFADMVKEVPTSQLDELAGVPVRSKFCKTGRKFGPEQWKMLTCPK